MKLYERFRKEFAKNDAKRDKGNIIPESVEFINDVVYGEHNKWNTMDIFLPKTTNTLYPVIINFHGGGWVAGDKKSYKYYCASLAEYGFAVFSFNYRLAPEYKFPTSIIDANTVINYIIEHKGNYHLDLNNVFAIGDSAGANLLSLYACLLVNENYQNLIGVKPADINFKAIALNCGKYNLFDVHNQDKDQLELMTLLLGEYSENNLLRINTISYMNENYPKTFLMTSNADFLKSQAPYMHDKLIKYNIEHEYVVYGDEKNPLGHVFNVDIKKMFARKCNKDEIEFFKKYIDKG